MEEKEFEVLMDLCTNSDVQDSHCIEEIFNNIKKRINITTEKQGN